MNHEVIEDDTSFHITIATCSHRLPIFYTFLPSLTHHLSMVKFAEKKTMLENFWCERP